MTLKFVWMLIFICTYGWVCANNNSESNFPSHSTGSLRFDVDVCQLDGSGDSTKIEIIYSVFLSKENTIKTAEENITTLSIDLRISNNSGQLIRHIAENKSVSLYDSLNQSNFITFMDIKKFNILADTVLLDMKIEESQKATMGQVSQSFTIRQFEKEFSVSDLYFASHVQRASGTSVFNKGGIMLVPNPSRLFFVSGKTSKVFVYYEINNLTFDANKPSFYEANAIVQDLSGAEVFKNPRKQTKVTTKNTSSIMVIPFNEFSSGVYQLTIDVLDIASGLRHEVSSYFKVDRGEAGKTNILPMSEAEEKKYFEQIKYIATDQQKDIFNKLDPRGKQEFLLHFWKAKDPDPGTPENEFMIEHFRRLDTAERKFTGGNNSDMGRIYITYGPPVDIERQNPMMIGARSIEIWAYVLDGRTDFVFLDRDGDGKYVLIHSTHRDEYSNPYWQEQIRSWGDQ